MPTDTGWGLWGYGVTRRIAGLGKFMMEGGERDMVRTTIVVSEECLARLRDMKKRLGIPQGEIVDRCLKEHMVDVDYDARMRKIALLRDSLLKANETIVEALEILDA
jgi:hypothetical protein